MTIKGKELGPDNKESAELVMALQSSINSKSLKKITHPDGYKETTTGVGKDIFGKYGFCEMKVKGKTYLMQIRDLEGYDRATTFLQGMAISGLRQSELTAALKN